MMLVQHIALVPVAETWLLLAVFGLLTPSGRALAQATAQDSARADELFTQGREQLARGDYGQACPLLQQSYMLDPATGSLLALALCHERQGQLTKALSAYREVLVRAEAERRPDRARAARTKIEALAQATASLRVNAEAVVSEPGLELQLNGEPLALAQLEHTLPVDAGPLCVDAAAPQKQPWRECLTAAAGTEHTVSIPALSSMPSVAVAPALTPIESVRVSAPSRARALRTDEHAERKAPAEWAGIALLSAGGVGFVTSVGFVLRADHQRDLGEAHCSETSCTPEGEAAREAEQRARDGALVSGMVGLAAAVAGVVTYVWGRHTRGRGRYAAAAPVVSRELAGVGVAGAF